MVASTSAHPLVELLVGTADPSSVAIVSRERHVTYGELALASARLAHELVARGVRMGDRVAVRVGRSPEVLALNLACARLGAIYVPLSRDYTAREVEGRLADARPALVIDDETSTNLDSLVSASLARPSHIEDVACDEDTPAAILFTSGTTGRPKGAVLTQGNLVFGARTLSDLWGIHRGERVVHVLPLHHVHGLFVAAYCALASGATIHFSEPDTASLRAALAEGDVFMGVPTHYTRLLDDPAFTPDLAAGVRVFISGSAPMRRVTHEAFFARTGQWVLERYGTTETGMIASNPLEGERRPGTVGRALPGVEVRLAATGEIEVRGPNVCRGYWEREDLRATTFTSDGFYRTGDLGRYDDAGYLEIVGRAKDLVISGGLNVYPREVEGVLDEFPGVLESAVVGAPDDDLGEVVVGVVVALGDIDLSALEAFARERLARFKVPRRWVVRSELPRNAMGKVEKSRLRQDVAGD